MVNEGPAALHDTLQFNEVERVCAVVITCLASHGMDTHLGSLKRANT